MARDYIGRFAPAPTGPLHFGSLVAALGSYLRARSCQGKWLVRIEDCDRLRIVPGASENILETLDALGLHWDGPVLYQSAREAVYQDRIQELLSQKLLYPCTCSRKSTREKPYPGTCRDKPVEQFPDAALRIRTNSRVIRFNDILQGTQQQSLEAEIGDFIVNRADGFTAYHLAVVIDDAEQKISEIVRGADLLESTPRQIFLQQVLGYPQPAYLHLPVVIDSRGMKISKQNHARELDMDQASRILVRALEFLGQKPETCLLDAKPDEVIEWGIRNWDAQHVPAVLSIKVDP